MCTGTMESRVPCAMSTGIFTSPIFESVSNFWVRMRPTGRKPHGDWSIISCTEVKVASSTSPDASGWRRASSVAMAPPSEWPTM